jgi:hypothetical protein
MEVDQFTDDGGDMDMNVDERDLDNIGLERL